MAVFVDEYELVWIDSEGEQHHVGELNFDHPLPDFEPTELLMTHNERAILLQLKSDSMAKTFPAYNVTYAIVNRDNGEKVIYQDARLQPCWECFALIVDKSECKFSLP